MSDEAGAARALMVLVAVAERAIDAMEALEPPADGDVVEAAERLRDLAMVELRFGRFRPDAQHD